MRHGVAEMRAVSDLSGKVPGLSAFVHVAKFAIPLAVLIVVSYPVPSRNPPNSRGVTLPGNAILGLWPHPGPIFGATASVVGICGMWVASRGEYPKSCFGRSQRTWRSAHHLLFGVTFSAVLNARIYG
jgi:hypothetical protein